ncbi:hypothetical protein V8C44DRAFT_333652 [Trichoderma aethiopicum]
MSLDANNWATGPFSSARINASWAQGNVHRTATHVVTNADRALLLPSCNYNAFVSADGEYVQSYWRLRCPVI